MTPPDQDAAADASVLPDALPQEDALPDVTQGTCTLTGDERELGAVPEGRGNQALAWDGERLVAVYQVDEVYRELRFAAQTASLAPLGAPVTFTTNITDCSLTVSPCHAEPALTATDPGSFALVWVSHDPAHAARGLRHARLSESGVVQANTLLVEGSADLASAPVIEPWQDALLLAWLQGPTVRAGAVDASGTLGNPVSVSRPAETAERPALALVDGSIAVLYTRITGSTTSRVAVRLGASLDGLGPTVELSLGLTRPRGVALVPLQGELAVVLEAEAPSGHGWSAAYVATIDPSTGAIVSGPLPAILAPAGGGVFVEEALRAPAGDIAIGATVYDPDGASAVLQRVNRYGQALHPMVQVSDGHPSAAGVSMSTRLAIAGDRYVLSFVAAPPSGGRALVLRSVTCDF